MLRTRKATLPSPTEAQIQAATIRRLRVAGWLVVRINGGGWTDSRGQFVRSYLIYGLNAIAGFPDCLALRGFRFLLLEFKTEKGKLSPAQERFIDYAEHFGIKVYVVRHPAQLDAILEEVRQDRDVQTCTKDGLFADDGEYEDEGSGGAAR